jgi:hypothetical protein
MRPWLLGIALLGLACDPCEDACELECSCEGDDTTACVDTCVQTLDGVFQGESRTEECKARTEAFQEECP